MPSTNNQPPSSCACGGAVSLIFPCSGAADVGEIADRAARQLSASGAGKMFCLAGVGGNVSGIVASTKAAQRVLVIDGCPLDCGRKTLETHDIQNFRHLRLTDLGMEKGKSPASPELIARAAEQGERLLKSCC